MAADHLTPKPLFDMGEPLKRCGNCKKQKPYSNFRWRLDKRNGRRFREGWCLECEAEKRKLLHKRERGLTMEDFAAMLVAQGGVCAICGQPERRRLGGKLCSLSVDHDHVTGKVRALLCYKCNIAIGFFSDDPVVCKKAAAYLERYAVP